MGHVDIPVWGQVPLGLAARHHTAHTDMGHVDIPTQTWDTCTSQLSGRCSFDLLGLISLNGCTDKWYVNMKQNNDDVTE